MRQCKWPVHGILILVLVLVVLCACAPAATSTTAQPAPTKTIRIGVIGPMNYMQGKDSWDGATMARDEINKAGGIVVNGTKYDIELVKTDSNDFASVPEAISAMERLLSMEKVKFVVGGFRSEAVLGQQELLSDYKAIYMNTGTSTAQLTERVKQNYDKYKYYFRANSVNTSLVGYLIYSALRIPIQAVQKQLGIAKPKFAVLAQKSAYVDPMLPMIKSVATMLGAEPVGEWRISATADTMVAELNAIADSGAQVMYFHTDGPSGLVGNKEWGTLQIPAAMTSYNSEAVQKSHWDATNGMCEYALTTAFTARVAITDKSVAWWDAYEKQYGNFPSIYSGTHSAIYVLKAAIENAGSLDTDAIIPVIEKTDMQTSIFRQAFYGMDQKYPHDTVMAPGYATGYMTQWIDRQLKVVWPDGEPIAIWPQPNAWKGLRYDGTVEYQLPPWVVKKYKGSPQ